MATKEGTLSRFNGGLLTVLDVAVFSPGHARQCGFGFSASWLERPMRRRRADNWCSRPRDQQKRPDQGTGCKTACQMSGPDTAWQYGG